MGAAELVDVGRKLTAYSPWLVPLSFSSPFRDGGPWGGLSARTHVRTGARPAVLVFLGPQDEQLPSDPSLTQPARLPAEIGRIEFKAFDSCPDPRLYAELLSLLTGLVLDESLPERRTVPDGPVHRRVAVEGLADPEVHTRTGELIDAATAALAGRDADLDRVAALRERWARRECPAVAMLAEHAAGRPVAGLPGSEVATGGD
jgi:gamma-glutamyl:cysteine ligase YbdK (ATP-grasp superfamily)